MSSIRVTFRSTKLPPPVHIEQITADGKTYWQNGVSDASSLHPRLPPLVRDLTIDYTALSFVAPEKVRFRFKLEGAGQRLAERWSIDRQGAVLESCSGRITASA